MIVILDSKRRLTVPTALAPAVPGDYFDAQFDAEEDTPVFRRLATKSDWLGVPKECPVSTDGVLPHRRAGAPHRVFADHREDTDDDLAHASRLRQSACRAASAWLSSPSCEAGSSNPKGEVR
jgi:hypothetical protein